MIQNRKQKPPQNKKKIFKKHYKKSKPKDDEEISKLRERYVEIDPKQIKTFADFPLSWKTQKGLRGANYKTPTDIQKESIGYALQGKDVMGAAITGSGKTLAFLIPVLENLFMDKWSRPDGIGALIISPTRELAYQIFQTLKKIGMHHDISAGLIIGGKNLKFEKNRMDQCNIIICTPGRILQHMDENPLFNTTSMRVLVLDEADRILDMGFEKTMNAILENLPPERQTMLFSATQTKSVKDLARLSLKNPIYVAPHEQQLTVPINLQQNYVVVNLEDKITMLWSFIKNHLKQKIIVFLASCKQVKYVYEIFKKLRPGTSVLALYGTLHQDRRVAIYDEFCRKSNVVLFATDIASRGLDFPTVNWVIQVDCPEDADQYIHRAGRTARHNAKGESLLVLLPSEEEAMMDVLKQRNVIINQIHIDPKKLFSPKAKIEAFLAQDQQLKETAQRAFVSYIKSVYLMKNKDVFKVHELDFDAFSKSLGLVSLPKIKFIDRLRYMRPKINGSKKYEKSASEEEFDEEKEESDDSDSGEEEGDSSEEEEDSDGDEEESGDESDSGDEKSNGSVDFNLPSDSEEEDNLLMIKRKNHEIEKEIESLSEDESSTNPSKNKVLTKAAIAKRVLKKKIVANKKVVFNEEGEEMVDGTKELQSELGREYMDQDEGGIDIEMAKKVLREEDKFDRKRHQQLVKQRKNKQKLKQKDSEGHDDFGSDSEEDDVDLSWLPDPDKIYKKSSDGSDAERNSEDEDSEEDQIHRPPTHLIVKNNKRRNSCETETVAAVKKKSKTLTLDEAEDIAMQLLQ